MQQSQPFQPAARRGSQQQQQQQQQQQPQAAQRPGLNPRAATVPARPTTNPASGESDSWIEITSHPSDASSSDERAEHPIITSGLRVAPRRRARRNTFRSAASIRPTVTESSSEAEPDDGERSYLHASPSFMADLRAAEAEDDAEAEAENMASYIATQLSSSGFTTSSASTDDEGAADDDDDEPRTVFEGRGGTLRPASHQQWSDNDEALKASLSTLLSCAAAARGLPKHATAEASRTQQAPARGGPVEGLRMVAATSAPPSMSASAESATEHKKALAEKGKGKRRSASSSRSSGGKKGPKDPRVLTAGLYTLGIAAGAIVVLTAISFSAGYFVGRDAGRAEVFVPGRMRRVRVAG